MSDPRHDLGRRAEELVADWLAASGWSIVARRWRVPEGELDLVCLDPARILVGVEVRARRSPRAGSPLESIDRRRIARLRVALSRYATDRAPAHDGLRLDLVAVTPAPAGWHLQRLAAIDAW